MISDEVVLSRIGDTLDSLCSDALISFNCAVQSYNPDLSLTWQYTIPEIEPLKVTFTITSALNSTKDLGMNITSSLLTYNIGTDNLISAESVATLTVPRNLSRNEIILECLFADLSSSSVRPFQTPGTYITQ